MVGEDRVIMSVKELRRVHVIRQTMERKLTQVEASALLGLTARQIRRLIERVEQEGDAGAGASGTGHALEPADPGARSRPGYCGCMRSSMGTLGRRWRRRSWRSATGSRSATRPCGGGYGTRHRHFTRRKRPHRAWRERKAHGGELIQLDGSHHDWFEGRGSRCVLMAYIDDANNRVYARFYAYEGTIPAMDSFQRYVRSMGFRWPSMRTSIRPINRRPRPPWTSSWPGVKPTESVWAGTEELGVEVIRGPLAQAKGRVERLFKTFQDRLIKEMRLAGRRHARGGESVPGGVSADLQPTLFGAAGPGRRSASAEVPRTGSWTASCA